MKWIWYQIVKLYISLGLFFYYKRIKIIGRENIPSSGAILFVSNHQNALIDPLLIATNTNRNIHFLTRAGVFKKRLISKLFFSLQMIPIYRVRDGWSTLAKNEAIFNQCFEVLNKEKALLIFTEGSHNQIRKVRPLSKGFTRILFGTIDKYPNLDIKIVPVGLNYSSVTEYACSTSIYFGKPIDFNYYAKKNNRNEVTKQLIYDVHLAMCKLTTHFTEEDNEYDKRSTEIKKLGVNFLDPLLVNKILSTKTNYSKKIKSFSPSLLYYLFLINSFFPILIWRKLRVKIIEPEFITTFRFAVGIVLVPIFYIIQALLISLIYDSTIGITYFIYSILLGLFFIKTSSIKIT